jgi:hypothetical protein
MPDEDTIKFECILTVRGDCGRVHHSFKDWQDCRTCGAILETRTSRVQGTGYGQAPPLGG